MPLRKKIIEGIAHIQATFNNTKISITDLQGNLQAVRSAGMVGFKGSCKGTPYGAQLAGEDLGKYMIENFAMKRISVKIKGVGAGRDAAIRALRGAGLEIMKLEDRTRLPHNGCRPRKKRRV